MLKEKIELQESTIIADDVQRKIKNVGVRGLNIEKAKEMGLFTRISYSLCAMHASVVAAYRIYSDVEYLLDLIHAKKTPISYECRMFEKSFEKFMRFWTDYYSQAATQKTVSEDTESLFHNIMRWAQLPEGWTLGDPQRLKDDTSIMVRVNLDDGRDLNFHRCVVERKMQEEPKESWCVTKYDPITKSQTTVNTDMDRASAMMVAKRLSAQDDENIYTASNVIEIVEKRIEVTPYKAFAKNAAIGSVKKILK